VAFGKGFAYAGYPPLFAGEGLLLLVVLAAWRPDAAIPRNGAAAVTVALAGLAVVQVADDLIVGDAPRIDIARGVAPITYAAFAFGLYALLRRWEAEAGAGAVLDAVEAAVVRVAPFVVGALAVLASLLVVQVTALPKWPGSGVQMLLTKSTDI